MIISSVANGSKACLNYPSIVLCSCNVEHLQADTHNHGARKDMDCRERETPYTWCLPLAVSMLSTLYPCSVSAVRAVRISTRLPHRSNVVRGLGLRRQD